MNYEVQDAVVTANSNLVHPKGELIELIHGIFVGIRLGLSDAKLMDYDNEDPVYQAIWNAENAIRERIDNRR